MATSYATEQRELDGLVSAAVDGDQNAWNAIVKQFHPLVVSVTRRYRLSVADAQEVGQAVWLKVVENLHRIRTPAALPGWIVTTTQRQALQMSKSTRRVVLFDEDESLGSIAYRTTETTDVDDDLLRAEGERAVHDALGEMTSAQRDLLVLLVAEPPLSYEEISRRLGMPIGSIGPTRARHLKKLRDTTAMRTYSACLSE